MISRPWLSRVRCVGFPVPLVDNSSGRVLNCFRGQRAPPLSDAEELVERVPPSGVQQLSGPGHAIARFLKHRGEQSCFRKRPAQGLSSIIGPHSRDLRHSAAEHGRARGIAGRCGTVCVREQDSAGRQPVNVRCEGLRVAAKTAHPVVQVIDCDKEDVDRSRGGIRGGTGYARKESEDQGWSGASHGTKPNCMSRRPCETWPPATAKVGLRGCGLSVLWPIPGAHRGRVDWPELDVVPETDR